MQSIVNVDEIKQAGKDNIIDVVSHYHPLNSKNKCNCPFHHEETPSFTVFPKTGSCYCFGSCAEKLDSIAFVQKKEGLDYPQALEKVAEILNFTVIYGRKIGKSTMIDFDKFNVKSISIKDRGECYLLPFDNNFRGNQSIALTPTKDIKELSTFLINKLKRLDVLVYLPLEEYTDKNLLNNLIMQLIESKIDTRVDELEAIPYLLKNLSIDKAIGFFNTLSPIFRDAYQDDLPKIPKPKKIKFLHSI